MWAHPYLLLAMQPQCPLAHTDFLTNVRDIERSILSCLEHLFEPLHNIQPESAGTIPLFGLRISKAGDHGAYQLLLNSSCHL